MFCFQNNKKKHKNTVAILAGCPTILLSFFPLHSWVMRSPFSEGRFSIWLPLPHIHLPKVGYNVNRKACF